MKARELLVSLVYLTLFSFLMPHISFATDSLVFFGTHSVGEQKGISVAHFDSTTGILTKPQLAAEAPAPAYFILPAFAESHGCKPVDECEKGNPS